MTSNSYFLLHSALFLLLFDCALFVSKLFCSADFCRNECELGTSGSREVLDLPFCGFVTYVALIVAVLFVHVAFASLAVLYVH